MALDFSEDIPADTYSKLRRQTIQFKQQVDAAISEAAAAPVGFGYLSTLYQNLASMSSMLQAAASVPGMLAYVRAQEDDDTIDIATEWAALRTAVNSAVSWLDSTVPSTNLSRPSFANFTTQHPISNTYSVAQTAQLRTRLTNISAMITI